MKHINNDRDSREFEEFKAKVISELNKKTNENLVVLNKGDKIIIVKGEEQHILRLENIWERYVKGEELGDLLDYTLSSVLEVSEEHFETNLNKIKTNILPKVNHFKRIADDKELVFDENIIPSLKIYYVIDTPKTMSYITKSQLEGFGISKEELHKIALENLRKMKNLQRKQQHGSTFFVSDNNTSYDSSMILITDYKAIKSQFKKDILIGVPHRDLLLIFDSADHNLVNFLLSIKKHFEENPYPIVPYVFLWNEEGFHMVDIKGV